jgi:hypothetical protein
VGQSKSSEKDGCELGPALISKKILQPSSHYERHHYRTKNSWCSLVLGFFCSKCKGTSGILSKLLKPRTSLVFCGVLSPPNSLHPKDS